MFICNHVQRQGMIRNKTKPLAGTQIVAPSATDLFQPGNLLDHLPVTLDRWIVQRLTQRDFWLYASVYSITVHIGDKGVLLIDCPPFMTAQGIQDQVAQLTPLPITTVVYSHPHADHIAATRQLIELSKNKGIELEIIATEKCLSELQRYREPCPLPTKVIPNGYSGFEFEGRPFKMVTPVVWAHCGGDSYTITPEGVAHFDDFVYPGALPLANISNLENWEGYITFLRCVAGDDWHLANLGHNNIGCKADVLRTLDYFKDIFEATRDYYATGWNPELFKKVPASIRKNTAVMLKIAMDMQVKIIAKQLYPKWHHVPHWEVARCHIEHVITDYGMYYDASKIGGTGLSFTPIAPPTT